MGNRQSRSLKRNELKKLIAETHFGQEEIKALHGRFQAISNSVVKDGLIDQGEFLQALGLPNSALGQRIFAVFDADNSGGLDFREFTTALSTLCTKATLDEKIAFSFKVYDLDGDGHIDKEELLQVLKSSMIDAAVDLSEEHLKALVDATFDQTDANGDGKISLEEYRQLVYKSPNIISNISIKSDLLTSPHSNTSSNQPSKVGSSSLTPVKTTSTTQQNSSKQPSVVNDVNASKSSPSNAPSSQTTTTTTTTASSSTAAITTMTSGESSEPSSSPSPSSSTATATATATGNPITTESSTVSSQQQQPQ